MKANGLARLAALCALALGSQGGYANTIGDLLINEVMANPAALPDSQGEWIELYNPTGDAVDLRGTTLGDDGGDLHRIESDLLILPGEYLTLARSADPGFPPDYVYADFTLANGSDEIVLRDATGTELRLDYASGFAVAGRSRELTAPAMRLADYALTPETLRYGPGDIGTPGAPGGYAVSAVPLPAAAWLFANGVLALWASGRGLRRSRQRVRHAISANSDIPRVIPAKLLVNPLILLVTPLKLLVIPAKAGIPSS